MPEFYIIIARKIFFDFFLGGACPPCLPSSTPMLVLPRTDIALTIDSRDDTALHW